METVKSKIEKILSEILSDKHEYKISLIFGGKKYGDDNKTRDLIKK